MGPSPLPSAPYDGRQGRGRTGLSSGDDSESYSQRQACLLQDEGVHPHLARAPKEADRQPDAGYVNELSRVCLRQTC
jgi:hypothetical protein